MSSLDRRAQRNSPLVAVCALVAALPLAGCIQPLYATVGTESVANEMRAVQIVPIIGRLGHYVEDELIFDLNGTGAQVPARYKLTVKLRQSDQTPLIDTTTGYPTASTVMATADYTLEPIAGGGMIAKGTAFVAATYDRTSQRFADVRAARDAEIRDARSLADVLRTKVASALIDRNCKDGQCTLLPVAPPPAATPPATPAAAKPAEKPASPPSG